MWEGVGLREWMEQARCLDSPGVRDKADMIADLLSTFGTRRAVMVGDRLGDRDAAYANGLPHIHLARGYAGVDENVACEAVIEGFDSLLPILARRASFLDECAAELLALPTPAVVGVDGSSGSGKTIFAEDLERRLRAAGRRVRRLSLLDFLAVERAAARSDPVERLAAALDLASLEAALAAQGDGLSLLSGPFLAYAPLAARLDWRIHLAAPEDVCLRRILGRDARRGGLNSIQDLLHDQRPWELAFERAQGAAAGADRRVDNGNLLDPR